MSITKNAVLTRVKAAVTAEYSNIQVCSERVYAPSSFPCLWFVEIDTHPEKSQLTLNYSDDQRRSTIELQAFSNDRNDATGQAENIIAIATAKMKECGYRCTISFPLDNGQDTNIKRHVARFTRFIGSGDTLPNTQ